MRKFLWLGFGLALATYGFSLIAAGEVFAPYRLRDGLLVALLGALIFAWHSDRLMILSRTGGERLWPLWGRILAGTGFACGAAAAIVLTLGGFQGWSAWLGVSLWSVGALALGIGLIWPSRVEIYPAPLFRWRVDAAGNWVRYVLGEPASPVDAPIPGRGAAARYAWLWLAAVGVGIAVRIWRLATLPPTCVDVECALALQLVEGSWSQGAAGLPTSLYLLLANWLARRGLESVAALRWAGAILGTLTLPLVYWAARAYVRRPAALLALLVAALLPWAVWSSRLGSTWIAAPLLLLWVLGAAGRGVSQPSHRLWGAAGVGVGLLLAQPLPLRGATLLWLLLLTWVAWAAPRFNHRGLTDQAAVVAGSALALGLAWVLPAWRTWSFTALGETGGWAALAGLLDAGGAPLDYFLTRSLLPVWVAGLAWVGWAVLARQITRPRPLIVLGGALLYALTGWLGRNDPTAPTATADHWLPLLAFIWIGTGLAADQLLTTFDRAWAVLTPLPRVVTGVAILLLLLLGRETLALTSGLSRAGGTVQNAAEIAMGQYLARCLVGEAGDDPCGVQGETAPTFYVPAAVLDHPATRLLLGRAAGAERVHPLDPAVDLLPTSTPTGDLFYLVALDNPPVIDLLQQLYPSASLRAEPRDQAGPTLFLVVQIGRDDALAHQGLHGRLYAGSTPAGEPAALRQDGPLEFAWGSAPPLPSPFHGVWEGSLLVPAAGNYTFDIQTSATGPDAPVISLQLDGNLLLDTSLGLLSRIETLAQGAYRLNVRYYAPGPPADWAIRWTPADIAAAPIPRTSLYSPPLPSIGLVGTYVAGSTWDGSLLAVRKDMILGAPVSLPTPYSVTWRGQLAVPRGGETIFAVTANGPVVLNLDGRDTLLHLPPTDLASGPGYSQAAIYLTQGWHSIELRYAPGNGSDLRLLWQPPGSGPLLLLGRYLLPTEAPVTPADVPLPAPPELIDARLGDDDFALSANIDTGVAGPPLRSLPPQALPGLLAEPVWSVGSGCGAGDGQFASPRGVAVDGPGNLVYVADAENRRVVELSLVDGQRLRVFALAEFAEPVDVALDPQGALVVLDAMAGMIFRIDRQTEESSQLALGTSFYRPRGLGVDAAGNIAVADTGGARVALLNSTGGQLAQFGGPQTQFGVGQPVDTVAVGDRWWALTAEDGRLWQLDTLGSLAVVERSNTLTGPQLAALEDGSGFLVSDPFRRTVIFLAPTGEPLAQLAYPDAFANPIGVAAARGDDGLVQLIVTDSATCQVSAWRVRLP